MPETIGWNHPVDDSDQWDGFNDSGIETFAGSPVRSLAREANQNSLDSGDTEPVLVKMKLHHVDTSSVPNLEELKSNMNYCYEASKSESAKAEVFFKNALDLLENKKMYVLEISDFNTKGMKGPCKNGTPYYAFVKAKGQSRKESDTAAGSYGIGKFAPYSASKIRTIYVSTVYEDNSGSYIQLTQGKSILMSHDVRGRRKQGIGFWGIKEKCQPLEGVFEKLPGWLQRANSVEDLSGCKGSKLSVLCFEPAKYWQEKLAVSVAENFFAAINEGKLQVEIDDKITLDRSSIGVFFEREDIRALIEKMDNEPEQFDNCRQYLSALQDNPEVIVEESETRELGLCKLQILVKEGLPKKVCALRSGMFITDGLNRLKSFSDFKEFVAVVQCHSKKGIELLRSMEPPKHDDFEPDRLPTKELQKKGSQALRDLSTWVRDMLKRHAKDPVSEVTEIDELRDFFGDEGEKGSGEGTDEINPRGDVIIRAKPLKIKVQKISSGDGMAEGEGEGEGEGGGGTGGQGNGGGGGGGEGEGTGSGSGGTGTSGGGMPMAIAEIRNIRALPTGVRTRKIAFTPIKSGKISVRLMEAGADSDYEISVEKAIGFTVKKGRIEIDVSAGSRVMLDVELNRDFLGALKVVANEI